LKLTSKKGGFYALKNQTSHIKTKNTLQLAALIFRHQIIEKTMAWFMTITNAFPNTDMKTLRLCLLLFLVITQHSNAQKKKSIPEKNVFSFYFKDGKKASLSIDRSQGVLRFRLFDKQKVKLEYRCQADSNGTFSGFTYSYWLRPGGKQNEGLDINYLSFTKDNTTSLRLC
jgi:hypothetical protein